MYKVDSRYVMALGLGANEFAELTQTLAEMPFNLMPPLSVHELLDGEYIAAIICHDAIGAADAKVLQHFLSR